MGTLTERCCGGTFRGWLFRVARNIAVDKVMEKVRGPSLSDDMEKHFQGQLARASGEFDDRFAQQVLHWSLQKAKPEFSDSTWQAFWMTAVEGKSAAITSEKTGLSRGNVYAAKVSRNCQIAKDRSAISRNFWVRNHRSICKPSRRPKRAKRQ